MPDLSQIYGQICLQWDILESLCNVHARIAIMQDVAVAKKICPVTKGVTVKEPVLSKYNAIPFITYKCNTATSVITVNNLNEAK